MSPQSHWPEYAIETASLATFMVSAVLFTAVVEHPASVVRGAIESALVRRMLIGLAMGVTAAGIIYSPWGQRSGAHLNPSVTLTFLRLGKVAPRDAGFYVLSQFLGGAAGILLAILLVRGIAADPSVNYVATVPGPPGAAIAFGAEAAISFGMMATVLVVSNTPRLARFTGVLAGCLIALYITVEAPLSGMSMNPARSFAPALAAGSPSSLWIYFLAPPLGMLLAAELYVRRAGLARVRCAKMHHPAHGACHFNCGEA